MSPIDQLLTAIDDAIAAVEDYIGRHRPDTVHRVHPGWMPPVGARRIAAACDDTALMPPLAATWGEEQ